MNILLILAALLLSAALIFFIRKEKKLSARAEKLQAEIEACLRGEGTIPVSVSDDAFARLENSAAELAARLHAAKERLRREGEHTENLIADLSHQLKTPLAAVRILVDSILGSDMPPELVREFIEGIGEETDRLTRLTEGLLSVTRLESRKAVTGIVEVSQVVRRVQRNLTPLSESAEISVNSSLDENCFISANSDDIYQIVFNLVENAIKYNRTGGSVRIYLYKRDSRVTLIVSDTGVGIPQEDIERVFERFYRVDKARSREAGGSGLGLSIVKHAVEQFSGEISVESTLGEGTRITVSFPLCEEGGAEL